MKIGSWRVEPTDIIECLDCNHIIDLTPTLRIHYCYGNHIWSNSGRPTRPYKPCPGFIDIPDMVLLIARAINND